MFVSLSYKFRQIFGLILFVVCFFVVTAFINQASAQINVEVDREFTLSKQGVMTVMEDERMINNFTDRFIPGGTERKYYFVISAEESSDRQDVANKIYASLRLMINGTPTSYNKIKEGESYGISYILTKRLNPKERQSIRIQYNHPELGEKVGGLMDAYVPAFSDDFQFKLQNTTYTYRTQLKIPSDSGDENIVSVSPISKFAEGGFDVYVFDQDSLVGAFVWIQRGSKQVYKFKITQPVLATESKDSGGLNEYRMIIPRNMDEVRVGQKVYISQISPKPVAVSRDSEGNVMGIFRLGAHQDVNIVIEGYAVLENKNAEPIKSGGKLDEIDRGKLSQYLQPAEFWEVDSNEIDEKRKDIIKDEDDTYGIIKSLYSDVVDSIDYSQVKRFGLNERQGALATLNGGAAVCMEYSDLYLTLARNAGVPSRAAFGYGYDSRLASDSQEAHQWVQSYLPEQDNWVSVDVTWGEAGPQVIGGDLNHFFTHIASEDPNTPSILSRLSIGNVDAELLGPKFEVEVLAQLPVEESETQTIEQLFEEYPEVSNSDRGYYWATLQNKYTTTIENLFSDPKSIDLQGWFLITVSALLGVILFGIATKIMALGREMLIKHHPRRKPRPHPEP